MQFDSCSGRRQWTSDGAKRLVGQQVERPVTVEEKDRAVEHPTRVGVQVEVRHLVRMSAHQG
ncbi:DUF6192 family protein [Streptomyces hebeiensis]|uniref:DUF6192 family protein n=1 Tax=Streptomyces hebeiensis TaxID=229486 RepID=UPI0031CF07FA